MTPAKEKKAASSRCEILIPQQAIRWPVMPTMEKIDGCDDRALLLTDTHLEAMRWGASVEGGRVPLMELTPGKVIRHDKGKMLGVFGKAEERVRVDFDRLALNIWVPLERQPEAESFVADVNKAIGGAAG
jgi:hypothetical protein